jgi:Oligosaccharide biosynthesis protein Alg14 like
MEMLSVLKAFPRDRYCPMTYVVAATDKTSVSRMELQEKQLGTLKSTSIITIPRSREVGQSWLTTILTTAYAALYSIIEVAKNRPDVVCLFTMLNGCSHLPLSLSLLNSLSLTHTLTHTLTVSLCLSLLNS